MVTAASYAGIRASSAAATSAATGNADLSERLGDAGNGHLPSSAAAATATAGAAGRARQLG